MTKKELNQKIKQLNSSKDKVKSSKLEIYPSISSKKKSKSK